MPVSCDPNDLIQGALCIQNCTSPGQREAIKIYLLALLAGASSDPDVLMENAKCINACIPAGAMPGVQASLLCAIANAGGDGGGFSPVVLTPDSSQSDPMWGSSSMTLDGNSDGGGAASAATAIEIATESIVEFNIQDFADLLTVTGPSLVSSEGAISISNCDSVQSVSFPVLVGSSFLQFSLSTLPVLATVNLPLLTTPGYFIMQTTGLVSLSLPLVVPTQFIVFNNAALVTISLPSWLPGAGTAQQFNNNALNAASVNHILARCVASAAFDGTLDLSGGTNAAPSGQGIIDVVTLTGRGATVTTN